MRVDNLISGLFMPIRQKGTWVNVRKVVACHTGDVANPLLRLSTFFCKMMRHLVKTRYGIARILPQNCRPAQDYPTRLRPSYTPSYN